MMLTMLTKTKVKLTCSCLEIYNEEIRDLLCDSKAADKAKKHDIQIDKVTFCFFFFFITLKPA